MIQPDHHQWLHTLFYSFIQDINEDTVFCFEESEKIQLENKVVLNLSIHPIRFADDIFFNFQTNNDALKERLKKYEVNYDLFFHYADIIKSTYLKTVKKNDLHSNSLLIVGQTEQDKVLFDGEKYLSLIDYTKELETLSLHYDHIYFKPHPYAKNNTLIFKQLKKTLPNMSVTHENIYHLLSNQSMQHIVGINSSVLFEAKYFKKEVTYLYKPSFDFGNGDIGIYGDYFSSKFWTDILEIEDKNISLPFTPNRLRKSLNDFWGYNEISDEIVLKDIFKSKVKYFISKYIR